MCLEVYLRLLKRTARQTCMHIMKWSQRSPQNQHHSHRSTWLTITLAGGKLGGEQLARILLILVI